jgi:hypothetical protein
MSDDGAAPKSAYELAMERLRKKDRDAGVEERLLSEEERAEIADIRRVYDARLAEREILHQSERRRAETPEALEELEQNYRRDRERIASERDAKIEKVRSSSRP